MSNSALDKEFHAGCQRQELRLQCCSDCGHMQFYPRVVCSGCGGAQLEWLTASGQGTVVSFTVVRNAIDPKFADLLPYVVALIDLQEGPRMMSVIVDVELDKVRVGDAVAVDFRSWGEEDLQPVFRAALKP